MSCTEEFIKKERENLKSKVFNKDVYYNLLVTYLNEPEFESHVMKKKGEEAWIIKDHPVKKFRKILFKILVDFGVDKADAEAVMTTYKFNNKTVDGMYDFINDFLYQYLRTGRTLQLINKENCTAALEMKEVCSIKNKERKFKGELVGFEDVDDHNVIKAKSKAPDWKRTKKDKSGKVEKVIKAIAKDL